VPAAERLDRLRFSDEPEYQEHAIHVGSYICPRCRYNIEFRAQNFREHETMRHSNLDPDWRSRFDAARPVNLSRWEFFLDFHCPGCKSPARIIYQAGSEWAMGAHTWQLLEVLESIE
jgi:hypothetical protein